MACPAAGRSPPRCRRGSSRRGPKRLADPGRCGRDRPDDFGPARTRVVAAAASDDLLDALRFAARRPGNARTVAALMRAIDGFRRPRPESVMGADELGRVTVPTVFLWGTQDPYLAPGDARPWIEKMPAATLHEVPRGHAPWIEDPAGCAGVITRHLTVTGFPPRAAGSSHPAA